MSSHLSIKVIPGASNNKIVGFLGDTLKLRIQAPPENGKANKEVVKLLSKFLNMPPKDVVIKSGHTSSNKIIELMDLPKEKLVEKLSRFTT